jgi:acetolactate synthase-1/2/3 large subunit
MSRTSDRVVDTLIEAGVGTAFTLPGLGITWCLDAFYERRDQLRLILTRSEQVASIMAQVVGRLTGRPGLFMGQGPFAATTGGFGILEAHFSGAPMVVLTETSDYDGFGQYGVYQTMTGDYGGADIQAMLRGMTKFCTYATEPQDAVYGLQMAFKHAATPRQGPAAVIMKSGIVRREMPDAPRQALYPTRGYLAYTPARPDSDAVMKLVRLLDAAERPIIIAGNGVMMAGGAERLARLAARTGAAVATSYNGKGVVDEAAPFAVGMLGTWGCPTANRAVAAADLVVMLGASMAPDYTRFRDAKMIRPGEQTLVQVDIDPRNAGWVYPVDLAITGDCADVLDMVLAAVPSDKRCKARRAWVAEIWQATGYDRAPDLPAVPGSIHYTDIVAVLQDFLTPQDLLTLDAGSNRIWVTNALRVRTPGQLIVPGGIGGMGWGAPAAAAAKLVHPDKRVTCLAGDGGFAMTVPVLATCVQENLPITVIVANNQGLGMVRDNLGNKRIAVEFGDLEFARIAEGFGCKGMRVDSRSGLADALRAAHKHGGPVVIDAKVDPAASHRPASDP